MPNRPKPTALKVLQGTDRKDRRNPNEPQLPPLTAESRPPSWLSPRGRAAWREMLPIVIQMKVMTKADPGSFAALCDAWGEYVDARVYVIKNGSTQWVETKNASFEQMRPQVRIAQDAWRRVLRMLVEFGMTPASRSKVSAIGGEKVDPVEKWMSG